MSRARSISLPAENSAGPTVQHDMSAHLEGDLPLGLLFRVHPGVLNVHLSSSFSLCDDVLFVSKAKY
ncbi:unnamed protein product [Strongylus vulgaris]|uniref:Uncharacterized protein n=1 Tax=Strongylus vulgaris TaxID=40348 RepID=A0A3P7IXL7_STRVU|nr:unnamed protein product [Strongylus vulgaris]